MGATSEQSTWCDYASSVLSKFCDGVNCSSVRFFLISNTMATTCRMTATKQDLPHHDKELGTRAGVVLKWFVLFTHAELCYHWHILYKDRCNYTRHAKEKTSQRRNVLAHCFLKKQRGQPSCCRCIDWLAGEYFFIQKK